MDTRVLKQFSKRMADLQDTPLPAFNWAHEKELLNAIRHGDIEKLSVIVKKHRSAYNEIVPCIQYAEDQSINEQFKSVSAFVLMSRAAKAFTHVCPACNVVNLRSAGYIRRNKTAMREYMAAL